MGVCTLKTVHKEEEKTGHCLNVMSDRIIDRWDEKYHIDPLGECQLGTILMFAFLEE